MSDRIKQALQMAAVQADHWPEGFGEFWGKTIGGEWTREPDAVAEYG